MLNLTIALNKHDDMFGKTKVLSALFSVLPRFNELEAIFRTLVALGTLVATTPDSNDRKRLISAVQQSETTLHILTTSLESSTDKMSQKVTACCKQIIDMII